MLSGSYFEVALRWHADRRWRKSPRRNRHKAEYEFLRTLRSAPAGGLFIDLGANVGDVAARALKYGMRVIAFEPDPVARRVLLARLGSDNRLTVIPKAVGGSARTATFHQSPGIEDVGVTIGSSLVQSSFHAGGSTFDVEVIDIVEFLVGISEPIVAIKMDIEGAEAECLEAILDAGVHQSLGKIFVETHERFSPELDERIGLLRDRIAREGIQTINLDWG